LVVGQDDQRVRRIKQYVLARLREELANAPRGAQARLAKRLGVSGAHLSNMLSSTPSRQPGEEFRRKVATHWGVTYAQLEALALGEEPPVSSSHPVNGRTDSIPPNLASVIGEYLWMQELPHELRVVVREQARQHYAFSRSDLTRDEWQRIMTGLEREALALMAHRTHADDDTERTPRKRRARSSG
jgi:transcriptional regulator with XRE-family HTH domain